MLTDAEGESVDVMLDSLIPGCKNFYWREALHLPSWGLHCFPVTIEHKHNIELMAQKLELVREALSCPLKITSWYRPNHYNKVVGGAYRSYHRLGLAVDFQPQGVKIANAKTLVRSALADFGLRMEDNGKGRWIHLDMGKPGKSGRFFTP